MREGRQQGWKKTEMLNKVGLPLLPSSTKRHEGKISNPENVIMTP